MANVNTINANGEWYPIEDETARDNITALQTENEKLKKEMEELNSALASTNSNVSGLITTQSFTYDSQTISSGSTSGFQMDVSKSGYTALGCIQWNPTNNNCTVVVSRLLSSGYQINVRNDSSSSVTIAPVITILYLKNI